MAPYWSTAVTVAVNEAPAVGVFVEGTTVKWSRAAAATVTAALGELVDVHVLHVIVTVYVYVPDGTLVSSQLIAVPGSGVVPVPHAALVEPFTGPP